MSNPISPEVVSAPSERTSAGRLADNPGGPGNPFTRRTAALRAYFFNRITECDLQEILDVVLSRAKLGHLPYIKLLFDYVIGKPRPVAGPELLDLQVLQMLQMGELSPESPAELCGQGPLESHQQATSGTRADSMEAAVQTAPQPAAPPPPPPANAPVKRPLTGSRTAWRRSCCRQQTVIMNTWRLPTRRKRRQQTAKFRNRPGRTSWARSIG
jgi:hypothetical protein